MIDREKVIKGLDVCLKNIDQPDCPNDCPYLSDCSKYENRVVFQPLMRDALALLKEQEAIEPVKIPWLHSDGSVSEKYRCGSCDLSIFPSYKFCPFCGQAVKWE